MELPEVRMRRGLRADGYRDDEIRRTVRTGELTAIMRGSYVVGTPPHDAVARHALLVRAAVGQLAGDAVVSHVSAAVLHRLAVWGISLERVHVTRDRRTGGRSARQVHVHTAPLDPHEIEVVAGLPVTTVARTVVDTARTAPFESAVVTADAALRSAWPDRTHAERLRADLAAAVDRAAGWRGVPDARRAVVFADGAGANVGESRSRVAILHAGLPTPVLQWTVLDSAGGFVGRVDFAWPALRTVGEFDGKVKYGRLLRPGAEPWRRGVRREAARGRVAGAGPRCRSLGLGRPRRLPPDRRAPPCPVPHLNLTHTPAVPRTHVRTCVRGAAGVCGAP